MSGSVVAGSAAYFFKKSSFTKMKNARNMKYYLFLPFLMLATVNLSGQTDRNTLRDALRLSELWKNINAADDQEKKEAVEILSRYQIDSNDFKSIQYLKNYSKLGDLLKQSANRTTGTNNGSPEGYKSGLAGLDLSGMFSPTLVIDALGKFAAKRFKEELTLAFLQKFRDSLCSEQYRELRILLPRTFNTLQNADVFNYAQFYQSMHENAQTDLYNLPENVSVLVKTHKNDIDPESYPAILGSLDLVRQLERRVPASGAIEFLAFRDYVEDNLNTGYGKSIRTLGIFSSHLHYWNKPGASGWADEKSLTRLLYDNDAFNLWMALVLKQDSDNLKKIPIDTGNLYDKLNNYGPQYAGNIREIAASVASAQIAAQNLMDLAKNDTLGKKDLFFQYALSNFDLLQSALQTVENLTNKDYPDIKQALKTGRELVTYAHSKRFGDALSATLEILKLIYAKYQPANLSAGVAPGDQPERARILAMLRLTDKYGNILIAFANAKNSDELVAVIEKAAAPSQSYLRKRGCGRVSAGLNMYAGVAGGMEYNLSKTTGAVSDKGGWVSAFTTPVGLSVNVGIGKKQALSLFLPIIDIGAVTALRLNDNISPLPELKWENVLAPGAYLVWGIGRTPLALALGAQYGPALRSVGKDASGAEIRTANLRFGATLTVDIPLFMFNAGKGR